MFKYFKKDNNLKSITITTLFVIFMIVFLLNNKKISDTEIVKISDSDSKVYLLDKAIQSQNRYSECIDEVSRVYEEKKINSLSPEIIEKTKICKSSIVKKVSKIFGSKYLVEYYQEMPQECMSEKIVTNFLNIEVDMKNKKSVGTWQNGVNFTESMISDINNSLVPVDCKSYAEFITTLEVLK